MATKRKKSKAPARKRNSNYLAEWSRDSRPGSPGVPKRYYFMLGGQRSRDYDTRAERDAAQRAARAGGSGWKYDPLKNPARRKKRARPTSRKVARRPAVSRKKARPAVKRKRNGSELESAAKMFKKFHGKQATKVRSVEQLRVTPSVLADCGKMVDLVVATDSGVGVRLTFKGGTRLGVTGNGGQLYFVGGDQAINLRQFPHVSASKDWVDLGEAVSICYHTSKDFHNFEKSDYEHEFGEEGGARPLLTYDVHSRRLALVGGDYVVKREGIVD